MEYGTAPSEAYTPLEVGGQITAIIDWTGASVTLMRTDATTWRVVALKRGTLLKPPAAYHTEHAARVYARSLCQELRQVQYGRTLAASPITTQILRLAAVAR